MGGAAEVGGVEWSSGGGHLLYMAEKKRKVVGYSEVKFANLEDDDVAKAEEVRLSPSGQ